MINKALAFQALTPVSGQLQVTGDVVNVRSGPSTIAQVIGQAYSGDILQAKAKNNDDWYQIDYQGVLGLDCRTVCSGLPAAAGAKLNTGNKFTAHKFTDDEFTNIKFTNKFTTSIEFNAIKFNGV